MPKQFSLRTVLLVTAFVAIGCLLAIGWRESILGRTHYSRRLENHIEQLRVRKPANLTPAQWECMVDWTRNLHGNSLIAFQTTTSEIATFESIVEERLSGNVDATTIEWVWDAYADVCPGGQDYQRFRTMVNEALVALKSPTLLDPPTGSAGTRSSEPRHAEVVGGVATGGD
ncbi:hypothetical protein NHH03_03310 [Stieleria sp. TO1_6]|uniref:hypothetical protein n=1 Tax=Stieleria tagensis TaxID=2956795 RepID=UPI00209B7C56|nr:hypothetical protein [Stieleria tagensis]MCO8120752.1 hypothetical protein [Stieleria tagensis]